MTRTPNTETLAQLVRTAEYQGASMLTLEGIIARAAEEGARVALGRCGLHDDAAGNDIRELRALLDAWRDTRRVARRTLVRWALYALLAMVGIGTGAHVSWFR
jgi:hypothetical protein